MDDDDAFFFNRVELERVRGRWAGTRAVVDWSEGVGVALLCKNKQEKGPAGASPVAALMPKSVSF